MTTRSPQTRWTGWDLRRGAAAPASDGAVFADAPASADLVGYQLLAVAGRGFRAPQYLTVSSADVDVTARGELLGQSWSLEYRQVAETAPMSVAPHAIYLLGVNPPEAASEEDLVVFNDFYTNVHLVEVAERRHALRAVRYELVQALTPPYQGPPRFLAAYEVDEAGSSNRRHTGPPYSAGPPVWKGHTTPWRLWYRRLAT